jgi:hypothetical protein
MPLLDPSFGPVGNKSLLADAVLHFEQFLCYTCGDIYIGISDELRSSLQQGFLHLLQWEPMFIKFMIDAAIGRVFHAVKHLAKSTYATREDCIGTDNSCPAGIRAAFIKFFRIIPTDAQQSTFFRQTFNVPALVPNVNPSPLRSNPNSNPISTPPPNPVKKGACRAQFLFDLQVSDKAGAQRPPCAKKGACLFLHNQVKGKTKQHLQTIVNSFTARVPPLLRDKLLDAVQEKVNAWP